MVYSQHSTAPLREYERRRIPTTQLVRYVAKQTNYTLLTMVLVAGFFTGGALAVRGGYKAARNGAIGCAVLLAVIEGVGIGFQRMLAGSTKLEVCIPVDGIHSIGQ